MPWRVAKRKREEDAEKKAKINKGISKYFNNAQSTVAAPKPKVRITFVAILCRG
jgi:DNA polymerase alpha subunit A